MVLLEPCDDDLSHVRDNIPALGVAFVGFGAVGGIVAQWWCSAMRR
ncbi:hypothetical protein MXD61_19390 [Frankia sp. AgPm24]|nr:hypothetical protein [Frankia sp. AgPm24]MCK9924002.1 hypothetical protein [Frankia sp. AgPm24]